MAFKCCLERTVFQGLHHQSRKQQWVGTLSLSHDPKNDREEAARSPQKNKGNSWICEAANVPHSSTFCDRWFRKVTMLYKCPLDSELQQLHLFNSKLSFSNHAIWPIHGAMLDTWFLIFSSTPMFHWRCEGRKAAAFFGWNHVRQKW